MKKDYKLIYILLSIELVLSTALIIVAAVSSHDNNSSAVPEMKYSARSQAVKRAMNSMFPNSMLLTQSLYSGGDIFIPPSENEPTSTPQADEYAYYSFNFTENGYTTTRNDDESIAAGYLCNGIEPSRLVIPRSKDTFTLGSLTIHNNYVPVPLDLTDILASPLKLRKLNKGVSAGENGVVIYYTHTSEAYCATEEDKYNTGYATTSDTSRNVVTSGTAIENILSAAGINVLNDQTVHDSGNDSLIAYDLSLTTLRRLLANNTSAALAIDVHRDGIDPINGKRYGPTVSKDGVDYAQIAFVIGLDYNESYVRDEALNPYWRENFKLAILLIEKLEEQVPNISRGITLRRNPYNQGEVDNTLLVEIGFDGNLTKEAVATAELLGSILAQIYT